MKNRYITMIFIGIIISSMASVANSTIIDDVDTMSVLFSSFNSAVENNNNDLNYYLDLLSQMNSISNLIGDYLQDLAGHSSEIEAAINRAKERNIDTFLYYILEKNPYDLFSVTSSSLEDFQNLNTAIQQGEFENLEINRPVPEPATILLFGVGLAGLAGYGRKRNIR